MMPAPARILLSAKLDTPSRTPAPKDGAAVPEGFVSILEASSEFQMSADWGADDGSGERTSINQMPVEISHQGNGSPREPLVIHDVLEADPRPITGLIATRDAERSDQLFTGVGAGALAGAGKSAQPQMTDSALCIAQLVRHEPPSAKLPSPQAPLIEKASQGDLTLDYGDGNGSLQPPVVALDDRVFTVTIRTVGEPSAGIDGSEAPSLLPPEDPESTVSHASVARENPGVLDRSAPRAPKYSNIVEFFAVAASAPAPRDDDEAGKDEGAAASAIGAAPPPPERKSEPFFPAISAAPPMPLNNERPYNEMSVDMPSVAALAPPHAEQPDSPGPKQAREPLSAIEHSRPDESPSPNADEQGRNTALFGPPPKDITPPVLTASEGMNRPPAESAPSPAPPMKGMVTGGADDRMKMEYPGSHLEGASSDLMSAKMAASGKDRPSGLDAVSRGGTMETLARASAPEEGREKHQDNGPDTKPAMAASSSPAQPLPAPAQQIISALTHQFARPEPTAASGKPAADAEPGPLAENSIRTLRIILQPEMLGDVEVTLRRTGGEVKVGLMVGSEAVAAALRQDLGLLQDRLISSLTGNTVPMIEISVRDQFPPLPGQDISAGGAGIGYSSSGGTDTGSNRRPSSDRSANALSSEKGDDDEQADRGRGNYAGLVV